MTIKNLLIEMKNMSELMVDLAYSAVLFNSVDAADIYLQIKSDQDVSFGLDVVNATTNPCLREDLQAFDWNNGVQVEADKAVWYDVDITTIKNAGKHVKLTFTNPTQSIVWVATVVSVNCPAELTVPMIVPVPAGMSVDHVIDYSIFAAADVDHLYVGVTTDSKISILAEAQSAEASDTDKDGCANATLLENAKNYTHPGGTAWYKIDGSFLANMSSLPTFRFATVSGETTKVTMGATVGCEYNIATKGSVSVPGGVDLSLRVPSFIFKVLKHLVREDVNEFYVQLTTDKEVEFAIDTTTTEDLTACMDAIDLVVTDSMVIDLAGNTDQWYKVDLSALKGTNKDLAVKAVNPSDAPVNVEVEVSTVCPVTASVIKEATVPASLNVTKVVTAEQIAKLFEKYPDLESFCNAQVEDIEKLIYSCGFYKTKAKDIKEMSVMIRDVFGGRVPDSIEKLTSLPGVGRKTANLLLGDLYGVPGSVVCDTHCIRICERLGLSKGKDPEKVEQQLRKILPPEESSDFCHRIVLFGRDCCTARNPKCDECPLTMFCKEFNP